VGQLAGTDVYTVKQELPPQPLNELELKRLLRKRKAIRYFHARHPVLKG